MLTGRFPASLVAGIDSAIASTTAITASIPNLITCHLMTSPSLKPIALRIAICFVSFAMKLRAGDSRIDFVQTAEIIENAKIPLTFLHHFDIIVK